MPFKNLILICHLCLYSFLLLLLVACAEEEPLVYIQPEGYLQKVRYFETLQDTQPVRYTTYKYDQHKRLVLEEHYDYPDNRYAFEQREYDAQNRLHKLVIFVNQAGTL